MPATIIKIKPLDTWDDIPVGLLPSGDILALDRIQDSFNNDVLDPVNFAPLTAGNGTVKENEALELNSPAAVDASAVYLKTEISKAVNDIYTYRWRPQDGGPYPFMVQQGIGAPIVGGTAAIGAVRVIGVYLSSPVQLGIFYIDNVGNPRGWNGAAWVAGAPIFAAVSLGTLYESQLEVDDANSRWRVIVKNITDDIVMAITDWVTWAATRDTGAGDLWFGAGDFYTDVISGKLIVSLFRNLFKPGPLIATHGEITGGGAIIQQIPITENVEAGASVSYKYNLNRAGLSNPKTLAEFNADLVGQAMDFFDMETTFTSDREASASFDINGGVIACTGDTPAPPEPVIDDYIMPMVAELVRDQLALILVTELPNLKAKAIELAANEPGTLQGIQAQADLDNGIYEVIENVFIEKGTDFTAKQIPGINVYYGRSDFTGGDTVSEQNVDATYVIEVHVTKPHKKDGDEIIKGDELSARYTARLLGIIRGIFMSGQYVTLGDTFEGIIWSRVIKSLDVFQPDFQEKDARHGIVGVINMNVKFAEEGPEISGTEITEALTAIRIKLDIDDDGNVINIDTQGG